MYRTGRAVAVAALEHRRVDDGVLVRDALISADNGAFALLHERYCALAAHIASGFTTCSADRDEVVQESFVRAWQRLGQLQDPNRFGAWFCQIVTRVSLDSVRRTKRVTIAPPEHLEAVPSPRPSPAEFAELSELFDTVDRALSNLSPRDATAIALVAGSGFGTCDLAAALHVTPGNAKVILHRARARLREEIKATVA